MKEHESVLMFGAGGWTYNPKPQPRTGGGADRVKYGVAFDSGSDNYRQFDMRDPAMQSAERVPSSWQKWNRERGLHPTQKPLEMMRYFIETYSEVGDTASRLRSATARSPLSA
jgi:site-specific DNA-methyltransferase (adenine-specific)